MKLKFEAGRPGSEVDKYQVWVDYDMKHYGKISDETNRLIRKAGLQVVKDEYGDYEVIAGKYDESLEEDTVKKANGKWTNRGDDGTEHGEFDTKKEADAQRKAMFAKGYKGENYKMKLKINEDMSNVVDIRGILSQYPDVRIYTEDELGNDYYYHTLVKSREDALKYNYHSDYWGDADIYQEENVDFVSDIESYVGKQVLALEDDDTVFTLLGVLIDDQYNSLSHTKLLVKEVDNDKVTESVDNSYNDYKIYTLSMDVAVPSKINLRRVGFGPEGILMNSIRKALKDRGLEMAGD